MLAALRVDPYGYDDVMLGELHAVDVDEEEVNLVELHEDWREQHAAQFSLEFLPPYSPELNPIEGVWKLTRRKCLHNRYSPSLELIIETVELRFAQWTTGNSTLRRLCAMT